MFVWPFSVGTFSVLPLHLAMDDSSMEWCSKQIIPRIMASSLTAEIGHDKAFDYVAITHACSFVCSHYLVLTFNMCIEAPYTAWL